MNSLLTNALIIVLIMDLAKYIKSEAKNEKIESLKWLIFAQITGNVLLFAYVNEALKKYDGRKDKMGYRDCPCVRCDHKAEGEKRVACRKKCTEFVAWKLRMAKAKEKEKEDKNTVYSATRGRLHRKKLMQEKSGRKW